MQKYRLDDFQYSLLGRDENYEELFKVLKIVKILSHGNARVESGLSVYSDLVVENLPKESLVAPCQLYGVIRTVGIGNEQIKLLILQNVLQSKKGGDKSL